MTREEWERRRIKDQLTSAITEENEIIKRYIQKKENVNNAITQFKLAQLWLKNAETSLKENYASDSKDAEDMYSDLSNTNELLNAHIISTLEQGTLSKIETSISQVKAIRDDNQRKLDNIRHFLGEI